MAVNSTLYGPPLGSGGTGGGGATSASAASWATTLVRYFLLDPVGGSDANLGYIDATAGSTLVPTGLAKQTVAGIMAILPPVGNNRVAVVLQAAATLTETISTVGISGYKLLLWRGSTDLTNTTADRITCGFTVVVAGPGGSSEFTATTGATTTTIPLTTGSFGAEPACIQYRVRFLPTTTTVALRNICRVITAHTTTVLTTGTALPAVPASGDVFVIEQPGAKVSKIFLDTTGLTVVSATGGLPAPTFVGLAWTATTASAFSVTGPGQYLCGMEGAGSTSANTMLAKSGNFLTVADAYLDESGAAQSIGMGLRTLGNVLCQYWNRVVMGPVGFMTASSCNFTAVAGGQLFAKSYLAFGAYIISCGLPGSTTASSPANTGGVQSFKIGDSVLTNAQPRSVGAWEITLANTSCEIQRMDITQYGAHPGFRITGNGVQVSIDGCTGSAGNTDVGIEVHTACTRSIISLGQTAANTVTGTAGDIRIGASAIAAHTDFTLTNVVDNQGNDIIGTAGHVVDTCVLVTNSSGGALAVGNTVRSNGTTGQVTTTTGNSATIGNSHIVGVMVTAPASATSGYMASDGTPYTLFDGAPTVGGIAYLSPGTAGKLTTTVPAVSANNNKLRVGRVITASGSTGKSLFTPDHLATVADGAA